MDSVKSLTTLCTAGVLLLLLAGCGVGGHQAPTPTTVPITWAEATETRVPEVSTPTPTTPPAEADTPAVAAADTPTPTLVPPSNTPTATPTPRPQPPTPTPATALQGRFVFQVASGGDIYTVKADGSNLTRLTDGMDPCWSPDGRQIAFSRWTSPWGIYTINADGTHERLLFSSNVARTPTWSPDGGQIAFYFETEGLTPPMRVWVEGYGWLTIIPAELQTEWHLGVVDLADGYLHQPYCDRLSFSPTWSGDGQRIAYDGDHGLSITTVEGPNNRPLTDNPHDTFPVWSPDGTRIAFVHWQHDHREIYIMNADGSGRRPLTSSSPLLERRPNNTSPAWSPDGSQIVFLSDRSGKWEFYVMSADGTNQRKILENVTDQLNIYYQGVNERVISWTK